MDPALVNGKCVGFHMHDLAGSIGADVTITVPTVVPASSVVGMRLGS